MVKDIFGKIINPLTGAAESPGDAMHAVSSEPIAVVILIADLDGLNGRDLSSGIGQSMASWPGVEVRLARKRLRAQGDFTYLEKLAEDVRIGKTWLAEEGADALIWGETLGTEGAALIRFLSATIEGEAKTGTFGLGDVLELPASFGKEFNDISGVCAISAAVTAKQPDDAAFARVLASALGRVSGFVEAPPPGLTATQSVSLMTCLGNCFAALWRTNGDDKHVERAIRIYRLALGACAPSGMSVSQALIHNHMAATYEAMAGRDAGTERLQAAADAYKAVITALGHAEHPQDWAFAQNRLGLVQYRLALRSDNDASHLMASAKAFDAARMVLTQDDSPDQWGEISNQLGVALMVLGGQVAGTTPLERSITAFEQAHEVRLRSQAPLLWAQTANNLGAASFSLFRRKQTPQLLEDAIRNFEGAREIYVRYRQDRTVAVIEKNLKRAREMLARK
ncbi:MAG: hypothetical protein H8E94_04100 [Alphaproteobacteria bacterium]|nr:hypothetical protein [Alphaproteobacteria bacterium]